MPREKSGHRQRGIMLPDALWGELDALAAEMGRSSSQEIRRAVERHLAARPSRAVTEPPLPADTITGPQQRRRGRPPKARA